MVFIGCLGGLKKESCLGYRLKIGFFGYCMTYVLFQVFFIQFLICLSFQFIYVFRIYFCYIFTS